MAFPSVDPFSFALIGRVGCSSESFARSSLLLFTHTLPPSSKFTLLFLQILQPLPFLFPVTIFILLQARPIFCKLSDQSFFPSLRLFIHICDKVKADFKNRFKPYIALLEFLLHTVLLDFYALPSRFFYSVPSKFLQFPSKYLLFLPFSSTDILTESVLVILLHTLPISQKRMSLRWEVLRKIFGISDCKLLFLFSEIE